ncbi:MAG TPA: hypothetical protein VM889_14025 [Candidatus Thermoplasmatota archaeon]|nr:hypothetical protein [Candidatus Thermoplasmatota archaeon]HWH08687.1 hypothetical protein [Candidatus Thermoplasmatota archaeon]
MTAPGDASDLFARLDGVYDRLQALNAAHQGSGFGCRMSGNCCKVGLELHIMETERIVRGLEEQFAKDPGRRERVVARLVEACHDANWKEDTSQGDLMCALFDKGCTVYGFRPFVCRMYGVIIEPDDVCPRRKMASGKPLFYIGKDVDALVREYYRVIDAFGRRYPRKDWTMYMPAAALTYLLPPAEVRKVRRTSPPKLWKRSRGYRTQFAPSHRRSPERAAPWPTLPLVPLNLRPQG